MGAQAASASPGRGDSPEGRPSYHAPPSPTIPSTRDANAIAVSQSREAQTWPRFSLGLAENWKRADRPEARVRVGACATRSVVAGSATSAVGGWQRQTPRR